MKKKNLLAENMLRFKAKNLSETTKRKIVKLAEIITEQDDIEAMDIKHNKKFPLTNITIPGFATGELLVTNPNTNTKDTWRLQEKMLGKSKNGQPYVTLQLTTYQPASNKNTDLAKIGLIIYKDEIRLWPQHTDLKNATFEIDGQQNNQPAMINALQDPNTYKNVPEIQKIQNTL